MRFSKSSWIFLGLGVAVIGAIMAGMFYSQQTQQQQDLKRRLATAQLKLAQIKIDDLTNKQTKLTQDRELYASQITSMKTKLTEPIDNIAALDVILESAHEFDLTVLNINSNPKSTDTLAGNRFLVLPFTLQVEGNISNIAGFVSNVKVIFPTSVVETYQFEINQTATNPTPTSIPTPTPTPIPAPDPSITPTPIPTFSLPTNTAATINIIIYDYKGDSNVE